MVREGIYQTLMTGIETLRTESAYVARGIFVLRRGTFIGVGHLGGIYEGTYWVDPGGKMISFDGCVRFEPGTKLVTGTHVGPEGLTMPFKGKAPVPKPDTNFSIGFEGNDVTVEMKFVSPLPA